MGRHLGALAVLALAAAALPARADIYRCTDSKGGVQYTSSRTPGMKCAVAVRGTKKERAKPVKSKKVALAASRSRAGRTGASAGPAPAERQRMFDGFLAQAARLYQLPVAFLRAVVKVESGFNPEVVSHRGAMGLMQLMPRTAAAMGVQNPFDPRQNIFGGSRYLRILANKFNGDLVLTIAAYNAGDGAVARYRGVPPYRETRRYVQRVLSHYYRYRQQGL
ncbi:MAG: lytic transglycosylase domain-containing protein [Myxococcota bacterium]